jgi:hypothetical protein
MVPTILTARKTEPLRGTHSCALAVVWSADFVPV